MRDDKAGDRRPFLFVKPRTPEDIAQRLRNLPQPVYPDDLPVVAMRADITRAISENQVVIICGETGSGKPRNCRKSAWSCSAACMD